LLKDIDRPAGDPIFRNGDGLSEPARDYVAQQAGLRDSLLPRRTSMVASRPVDPALLHAINIAILLFWGKCFWELAKSFCIS
jgi:hypothetical protein